MMDLTGFSRYPHENKQLTFEEKESLWQKRAVLRRAVLCVHNLIGADPTDSDCDGNVTVSCTNVMRL